MGKMISLTSVAVAAAATGMEEEERIDVPLHSGSTAFKLASLLGLIVVIAPTSCRNSLHNVKLPARNQIKTRLRLSMRRCSR